MNYTFLPNTSIKVSKICLGTMTFGKQNSEEEAHQQLDYAFEQGINFIDTAEMYPIAACAESYGRTEKFIGNWLKETKNRDKIVLATKITGPNRGMKWIREDLNYKPESIKFAFEKSLKNLQTDVIDLYQLHWPERKMNMFGQRNYKIQDDAWEDNFKEVLETLQLFIKEGKLKHIGVSNETSWGIMRFLEESKIQNLPRIITTQNAYSLINRQFEVNLAEISQRENVGLLAYSPLAFGALSGKYLHKTATENARLHLFPQFTRYSSPACEQAIDLYEKLAHKHQLTLVELALAFVQQQPFVTSTIIGATTMEQLKENIATKNVVLSPEILKEIDEIQAIIPDPSS